MNEGLDSSPYRQMEAANLIQHIETQGQSLRDVGNQIGGLVESIGTLRSLFMVPPPPPPPPPVFNTTETKKRENHGGYRLTGPHKAETIAENGTIVIESQATAANPTTLVVNHPPPAGAANQTHQLRKGDRVTIYPNGDIVIQQQ